MATGRCLARVYCGRPNACVGLWCRRFTSWKHQSRLVAPFASRGYICTGRSDPYQGRQEEVGEDICSKQSEWLDKGGIPKKELLWLKNQCQGGWGNSGSSTLETDLDSGPREQGSRRLRSSVEGDEFENLCKAGKLDNALGVLLSLTQQGISASIYMYSSLLKACARRKDLQQARRVLAHFEEQGLQAIRFLGEYMVSTLVKCGGLGDALNVFQRLPDRTVFSWTALISGYASSRDGLAALKVYRWMQHEGVEPNAYTFISLLKACAIIGDLEEGKFIHAEAVKYRCADDLIVLTCLLDMYGKCGSILDAQAVFDRLWQKDVVSWTVMLAAYTVQGEGDQALLLYEQMRSENVSPDTRTFVSILQACGMLADDHKFFVGGRSIKVQSLELGKALHAEAWRKGYDSDVFVGSTLVSMYGKCGSILDSQTVFSTLSQRNVVSWNAMLAGYVEQGEAQKVLMLCEQMQEEGVSPDIPTFVSALQACGLLAELEGGRVVDGQFTKVQSLGRGKAMHAEACRKGYQADLFVGNTLVCVYGKCGSIMDAENVFNALPHPDVVAWTAMLSAYVEQSNGEQALEIYEQMLEVGVSPHSRSFVCALQACGLLAGKEGHFGVDGRCMSIKYLHKGKAIHAATRRKGCDSDAFVASTLIHMYGKCGSIFDACNVFDGLFQPDAVAWSAIVMAHIELGFAEDALQLHEQMILQYVSPDVRTFVAALRACYMLAEKEVEEVVDGSSIKCKSVGKGKVIHYHVWREGYDSDLFVRNSLISMYGKCGSIVDAWNVFSALSQPDVASWNEILAAYAEHNQARKALQLYEGMLEEGLSPNVRTFISTFQICGMLAEMEDDILLDGQFMKVKSLAMGKELYADAKRKGYDSDAFVGNTLVSMYGKCGSIADAHCVFDGLSHRNVVSWNAMLAAYVQDGPAEKALLLYEQMQDEGVTPSDITFVCILQICSSTGGLEICREVHRGILSNTKGLSLLLGNTLIHAYGRCASMADAQRVFDTLPQPDVVSWNALIAGYARQGTWAASLQCYEEMQLAGIKPDGVTFISVLSACTHTGLVEKGVEYFNCMSRDHCITPDIEHYVCMVDLLGRAGQFRKVELLLSTMPKEPTLSIWLCLLGACQKHGQVLLGKQAFDRAVQLQPQHAAAYVLMSNIYAHAGLWDCANEVKKLGQKEGAWKKPGQTWIGNDQEVETFLVGDHKQHKQLYDLLGKVSKAC